MFFLWFSCTMASNRHCFIEALPWGYGEQGNNVIYFRAAGEHKPKNEGIRGTYEILGCRDPRKLRFWFWGTRENADIFQGNKGRSTTLPGRACLLALHYENTPIQIYWKFYHQKKVNFQIKIWFFFSYFCSKHRLWVLVRTASPRRF